MSKEEIIIKELTSFSEIEEAILKYKDTYFLRAITNDDNRKYFIEKHIKNGHFLVEYHGDNPVGFFSFYSNDTVTKIAFVTALSLSDELGFLKGKTLIRLLNKAYDIMTEAGMKTVQLEVEADNTRALKLYKHFGFAPIPNEKENIILMEMELSNYKSVST